MNFEKLMQFDIFFIVKFFEICQRFFLIKFDTKNYFNYTNITNHPIYYFNFDKKFFISFRKFNENNQTVSNFHK